MNLKQKSNVPGYQSGGKTNAGKNDFMGTFEMDDFDQTKLNPSFMVKFRNDDFAQNLNESELWDFFMRSKVHKIWKEVMFIQTMVKKTTNKKVKEKNQILLRIKFKEGETKQNHY